MATGVMGGRLPAHRFNRKGMVGAEVSGWESIENSACSEQGAAANRHMRQAGNVSILGEGRL